MIITHGKKMIFIFIPFSVKKERGLSKLKVVNYGITYQQKLK